jgi:hypothetical protein
MTVSGSHSPKLLSMQWLVLGTRGSGKTSFARFLIQRLLETLELEASANVTAVLGIDLSPHQTLTQSLFPEQTPPLSCSLEKIVRLLREKPATLNSQWVDCLLSEAPWSAEANLDWLTGPMPLFQAGEEPLAGELAFCFRRLVRKTYPFVVIDEVSPFWAGVLQEESLQPVLIVRPEELTPSFRLQSFGFDTQLNPPAILMNQTQESTLPLAAKRWLDSHDRCVLLGKIPYFTEDTFEAREAKLEKAFSNALTRMDTGLWL